MLAWPSPCVKSYPPHFSVLNPQEKHGGFSCSAQPAWQIITVIVEATQQSSLLSLRKETSVPAKLLCWASGKPDWRRILWYVIRASDFLGVSRRTLPATLQPRHQGICIMKNSYCNIPLVSFLKDWFSCFLGVCVLTGQLRLQQYLGVSEAGFRVLQEAPEWNIYYAIRIQGRRQADTESL